LTIDSSPSEWATPKVSATAKAVAETVVAGEKVLLFCDHHATAQEMTLALDDCIAGPTHDGNTPRKRTWKRAWDEWHCRIFSRAQDLPRRTTKTCGFDLALTSCSDAAGLVW